MKLITVVVKLDHVMQAISGAGAHGLTVTESTAWPAVQAGPPI